MTMMEPPANLLDELERHPAPATWAYLGPGLSALMTAAATVVPLEPWRPRPLPGDTAFRVVTADGRQDPPAVAVRVHLARPGHTDGAVRVALTHRPHGADAPDPDPVAELWRDEAGWQLRTTLGSVGVGEPGWCDVVFGARPSLTVAGREPHDLGVPPDAVTLRTSTVGSDAGPVGSVTVHDHLAATGPPDRGTCAALMAATFNRLDESLPGWRTLDRSDHGDRPALVVAGRREARRPRPLPEGGLDLVGWLSEGWQRRIDARDWDHMLADGTPVDPGCLDAYGRAGGLIVYAGDRRFRVPPSTKRPAWLDPPGPQRFTGDRDRWMCGLRNAETLVYQLSTVWYFGEQTGEPDPSGSASTLEAALLELWHPAHAFHLDVVAVVARAIGRFRYSDESYAERAPQVLARIRDHLRSRGIGSRPVVLS